MRACCRGAQSLVVFFHNPRNDGLLETLGNGTRCEPRRARMCSHAPPNPDCVPFLDQVARHPASLPRPDRSDERHTREPRNIDG